MLKLKRVYEEPVKDDGLRIHVERLWPRGLTREKAKIDLWLKDVAPSAELRKWFGHDPTKWIQFCKRYESELKEKEELVDLLRQKTREGTITLLYAARNEKENSAVVLKRFIEER